MYGDPQSHIETYPVGLLSDLKNAQNRLLVIWFLHRFSWPEYGYVWRQFWRRFKESYRRKNYYNGYLAEWHYPPEEMRHYRCGKGWTRKRALKDLGAHIIWANLGVKDQTLQGGREVKG